MKFPFWATTLTLLAIAILCALGAWQLQRLDWKQQLLAQIEATLSADPMQFEFTRENLAALPQDRLLVRGFAEGIYLHEKELLLGPRTHDGAPGYHVITPFETLDNSILLINRGWVPLDARKQGFSRPDEPGIVTGTARKPEPWGPFVPPNEPRKDEWYRLDPGQIAAARALGNVLPYIVYADPAGPLSAYPLASTTYMNLPNNHLSYAIFWFTMAGLLALIFIIRFRKHEGA